MTERLELILHAAAGGELALWACRGEGKGCRRNSFREKKVPCDDCFGPLPDSMTIGDVRDKLERGDG